jgi:hypothetical protein
MKVGTEDKKKLILACVLGVVALISAVYLYGVLFGGPSTPPPTVVVAPRPASASATTKSTTTTSSTKNTAPVPVIGAAAQKLGSTSGQLDPTLHMEAMLRTEALEYSGSGRNIFSAAAYEPPPPPKIENAAFKARTTTAPPPPVNQAPQVAGPPPINMKFFGTATSANGTRRAFLIHGDDVILAGVGDVVERRYRIVSISANSILVEDIPNSNKQTLPLVAN